MKALFILSLITLLGLFSCADVSEEVIESGGPSQNVSTFSSDDKDGDGIKNSEDKEPNDAYIAMPSVILDKINSRIELQNGSEIVDFQLTNDGWEDHDEPEPIEGTPLSMMRGHNAIANFYTSKDSSYLDVSIRNKNIMTFPTNTLRDKAINLALLRTTEHDQIREKSGEVEIEARLKTEELMKDERINNIKIRLYTAKKEGNLKSLKSFPASGEITISTNALPFETKAVDMNSQKLFDLETTGDTYIAIGIDDFDHKRGTRKKSIAKIKESTIEINILTRDEHITNFVHLEKASTLMEILSNKYKDDLVINGKDFVFRGLGNNLSMETKPRKLEENENGRWFILSPKATSLLNGTYSNGEAVTLIYMTGDELYKALSREYLVDILNLNEDSGTIRIPEANKVEILFQGKKKFGSQSTSMNTPLSYFATGGAPGHYYGQFLSQIDSELKLTDNGDEIEGIFEHMSLKINADTNPIEDIASVEFFSQNGNYKVFSIEENYLKKNISLNIFPGSVSSSHANGFHSRSGWNANGNAQIRAGLVTGTLHGKYQFFYNAILMVNSIKEE